MFHGPGARDLNEVAGHPHPTATDTLHQPFRFALKADKEGGGVGLNKSVQANPAKQMSGLSDGFAQQVQSTRVLDAACGSVAAYGWPEGVADEEILARLLALNLERAGQGFSNLA